jgi:hypothetical protein
MKKMQDDMMHLTLLNNSEAHLFPNNNKYEDLNTIEIEFLTGLNDDVTKNGIQIYIKEFLGDTTYLSFNIKRSSAVYLHSFLSTYLQLND